jgi:hypothetical protein
MSNAVSQSTAAANFSLGTEASMSNTERVISLIDRLTVAMDGAIADIRKINGNTKLLALNARIEAARSGDSGAAFGVVAQEMQALSGQTATVADSLSSKTHASIAELVSIISGNVRGTRMADLALTCVDLTDRNLYERTCDVRWWATDSALVDALSSMDEDALKNASKRMGVILNAYTVYHDLVICNREGTVLANGRPDRYGSRQQDVSKSIWFHQAMQSSSGDEFGFQGPVFSNLVNNQSSLIYSCGIRQDGNSTGSLLGVLGVIFKWDAFAQAILQNLPLDKVEKERTLGMIIEADGSIVASSKTMPADFRFPVDRFPRLMSEEKGYMFERLDGKDCCLAIAKAPGFETYSTGWYAVLQQEV